MFCFIFVLFILCSERKFSTHTIYRKKSRVVTKKLEFLLSFKLAKNRDPFESRLCFTLFFINYLMVSQKALP